jgi:CRP/FNR family cyclic AMP-dependent transcriptional regulator
MFGVTREQLGQTGPLADLDPETVDAVMEQSLFVWVPRDQTIVHQGDAGHEFYIILTGHAEVRRDGSTVAELGPGDVFGEMAASGATRSADVVAIEPLTLMTMSYWNYRHLERERPDLANRLSDLAASRRPD